MKPNIVWFDIPALDLDRAAAFYSAVLGAPVEHAVQALLGRPRAQCVPDRVAA